jgi:hypothetical protein
VKLLFLEKFSDNEPFLEQSYNEVTKDHTEYLTLRVFESFSDLLNYYDFVSTQFSGGFVINSFDVNDQDQFIRGLAEKTKLLYNSHLSVKKCKMEENEFPRTEEVLFVTNPSIN